jgi:Ku protein
MQRSLWRGAISFGLIYVPVELYSASKDGALDLHMLDSRDFAPVGYQRINKTSGKTVDWQHIVKGYEYKKGQYVALSDAGEHFRGAADESESGKSSSLHLRTERRGNRTRLSAQRSQCTP